MKQQTFSPKGNRHFFPGIIIGLSCLILGLSLLFPQGSANAAQVTLAWDQSSGAAGYKIYSGTTSNSYTWVVDIGNTTSYTTATLTDGYTYYFAATAYDASRLESDYSDEVSYNATTVPCSYSISPSNASFAISGGSGSITVTTQSGCAWSASSGVSWITITSGGSGTGSGTVAYSVTSNSGAARSVVSTIAGKPFTFNQSGAQSYTLAASAGTGGSISPSGNVSVTSGASQSFTITPASGYSVSGVTVDGASVGAVTYYTFSNVTANHTIAAAFTPATSSYTLTITKSGTGTGTVTTSPSGTTFSAGTVVTLTATANTNSTFTGWSGACSGTATTSQVTMNANKSVGSGFALKSYTLAASAGTGGSISPSGNVSVTSGASQSFTITPASGYSVSGVTVDGASVGAVTSYTFSNVTANHTIAAAFTPATSSYTLTITKSGTGTGTVTTSPSGTTFAAGTTITITATPDAGSTFTGWSGASSSTEQTIQWSMPASNVSLVATFTRQTASIIITASAGTGGSISPSGAVSVAYGSSKTFAIAPRSGYKVWFVVIDNKYYSALTSYTFTNVRVKHTIKAYFTRSR